MNKTYLKLSLDLDFVLIAITAAAKDYILCHKINSNVIWCLLANVIKWNMFKMRRLFKSMQKIYRNFFVYTYILYLQFEILKVSLYFWTPPCIHIEYCMLIIKRCFYIKGSGGGWVWNLVRHHERSVHKRKPRPRPQLL